MAASKKSLMKKKGIQAVLLADSFMTPHRFRPMTSNGPKVLLPVVNVPMLEYTLEFLSTASLVDEIIIFAASHADQIQSYINNTRWLHKKPDLAVEVIVSTSSKSVGDALRYLDQLDKIRNDFILLTGDVISNIDLNPIITEHRQKSQDNSEITMTMLFTTVQPGHAMRSRTDDLLLITSRQTNRILFHCNNIQQGIVDLPLDLLAHGIHGIDIKSNVFDTGIVICNKRLLNIFSEQFDYREICEDYVAQQLNLDPDSAIPPDHIHAHFVAKGSYASRIVDMRTYHTCSHDILRKWVSPIIVSNNVLAKTSYKSFPNNIYREDKVSLSHTTLLRSDCVVGRFTKIGFSTVLHKAILGRNINIGNSVSITTCYILDNTTIGDNVVMNGAFIGKNCKIGNNVIVHKGVVLDNGVVIDDNIVIPPYVSITTNAQLDDEERNALEAELERKKAVLAHNKYVDVGAIYNNAITQKTTTSPTNLTASNDNTIVPPCTSTATTPKQKQCELKQQLSLQQQPSSSSLTHFTPEQRDYLDRYPIDGRTFFYNNETEQQLAARIHALNATSINTEGYDEDETPLSDLISFPRLMLPSLEVLQLDSSPHPIFSAQTMTQIIHSSCMPKLINNNNDNNNDRLDDLDDGIFLPIPQQRHHNSGPGNFNHLLYNQCDVAKNVSPYTNKSFDSLLSSTRNNQSSLNSPQIDGSVTMLSPSALQQTLTNNHHDVSRALQRQLPYYPLADLSVLHAMDKNIIVGPNGNGRLYLQPPHKQYGRAIVLLNSTSPPAYLTLSNYPLLSKSKVIAETIEYDGDFNPYSADGKYDSEFDDEDDEDGNTFHDFSDENEHEEDDDDINYNNDVLGDLMPPSLLPQASVMSNKGLAVQSQAALAVQCTKTLQGVRTFIDEIVGSMKRALEGEKVDNIIQELPTLRLVYRDVGFDVYICAAILGIFSMAGLPPPNNGFLKTQAPLWPLKEDVAIDVRKSQLIIAKLLKVWLPVFKTDNPSDALGLLLPALSTACLLNDNYRVFFRLFLNQFHASEFIPDDAILDYHERISSLITLHTTAKSLLPSLVAYNDQGKIIGLDVLFTVLDEIVDLLQEEDEDEDEDEDE